MLLNNKDDHKDDYVYKKWDRISIGIGAFLMIGSCLVVMWGFLEMVWDFYF